MANHSPLPDNYVGKKTWEQAMEGEPAEKPVAAAKKERGEAAKNGGGK